MLRMLWHLQRAMWGALFHRRNRGWSLRFEIGIAAARAFNERLAKMTFSAKRVARDPATVAGVDGEWYDRAVRADFDTWQRSYYGIVAPRQLDDLRGLPPLRVSVGGKEMLIDQVRRLVEKLRAAGVSLEYDEAPEMVHNSEFLAGSFADRQKALENAADFLLRVLHRGEKRS